MVTVYLWFPSGNSKYGHSAAQVGDTYISWWPIDNTMSVRGTRAFQSRTHADDLDSQKGEGRKPDHSIPLKNLDEPAIRNWWREWRHNDQQYRAIDRNCSTTVAKALKAGGGDRLCNRSLKGYQLVWTPNDIWEYARAISIGIYTPR
jgi:hypothetical protein